MTEIKKPLHRSVIRSKIGMVYYGLLRKFQWIRMQKHFSKTYLKEKLPYTYFSHQTILLRKLKDVDMWMQYNKITNLEIAVRKLDRITLYPGEILSYWKILGKPTKKKGYVEGMVLHNGTFESGVGGGLCQLSNLLFWMTVHTPLTVIERHRHGYDVFPDSNRTQPFGSGATCYYPHGDLMIQNNTDDIYQLLVSVGDTHLEGEWRLSSEPQYRYDVFETNHEMRSEFWGGYSRHNELVQKQYTLHGELISEKLIIKNSAIMMYSLSWIDHLMTLNCIPESGLTINRNADGVFHLHSQCLDSMP